MNSNDFAMWLNGFFELSDSKTLNESQVRIIREHLNLVFKKVTPDIKPHGPLADFETQEKDMRDLAELFKDLEKKGLTQKTYCASDLSDRNFFGAYNPSFKIC